MENRREPLSGMVVDGATAGWYRHAALVEIDLESSAAQGVGFTSIREATSEETPSQQTASAPRAKASS